MKLPNDWHGLVVLVLAIGVSIGFGGTLVAAVFVRDAPLSSQAATMLATIGGAMVGAIASYLGRPRNGPSSPAAP